MLDREKILENMWSSSAYDDFVVFSEVNGMQRNDIPIFYKYTDGNSIFNDMNQEKDGYFSQDAYSLYPTYMEAAEEAKVEVNGDLVSLFILDSEIKESVEEQYYKLIKK